MKTKHNESHDTYTLDKWRKKSCWSSWLFGPKCKFLYILNTYLMKFTFGACASFDSVGFYFFPFVQNNNSERTWFLVSIVIDLCGSVQKPKYMRITCLCINFIIFRSVEWLLHELCERCRMDFLILPVYLLIFTQKWWSLRSHMMIHLHTFMLVHCSVFSQPFYI